MIGSTLQAKARWPLLLLPRGAAKQSPVVKAFPGRSRKRPATTFDDTLKLNAVAVNTNKLKALMEDCDL